MSTSRLWLTAGVVMTLVLPVVGCSPAEPTPGATEVPAVLEPGPATVITYGCASGREITVSYPDGASIRLAYLGQDHALAQVPAASGAHYAGADLDWVSSVENGQEAAVLSRTQVAGSGTGSVLERCTRAGAAAGLAALPTETPPAPIGNTASAAPCKGPQLQMEDAGGDAGMGNRVAVLAVRNLGTAACGLSGYPTISLVDDRNRVLEGVRAENGTSSYFRSVQTATPVSLAPGGRVWFDIAWNVVPHEAEGETVCPRAARVRMTAPGDTSPVWLDHPLTPCGGRIRVGPFRPAAEPVPVEPAPAGPAAAQP